MYTNVNLMEVLHDNCNYEPLAKTWHYLFGIFYHSISNSGTIAIMGTDPIAYYKWTLKGGWYMEMIGKCTWGTQYPCSWSLKCIL